MLAPIPSMTTLRLAPKKEARGPAVVARGTLVDTEPVRGETLRYATCHDVTLWPLQIDGARLTGLPLPAPANPRASGAVASLRLALKTAADDLSFAETGLDRLRLHIRGPHHVAAGLHELLATACVGIALADSANDPLPTLLGPEKLAAAGFERAEAALPWPQRAFDGHRLLTEYFAHPERFFYIDIDGLEARTALQTSGRLDIFIYLSRAAPELERLTTVENFALHSTPAVNLFPQRCEPIALDGTQSEWLVIPDLRRPAALEVYAIEAVRESRPDGARRTVQPFQRLARDAAIHEDDAAPMYYVAARSDAPERIGGSQISLMTRDPGFAPDAPADGVLTIESLCLNRDLPSLLPFGGGQPRLRLADQAAPADPYVECLSAPTPTLRPPLHARGAWRLISHLALNHLSVTGGPDASAALREMLSLHDLRDTPETRGAIAALLAVRAEPGMARIPGRRPGVFARGIDVSLTFDPQAWQNGGLYVLGCVIERFLALQVSVNGFVRTRALLRDRATPVATWAPRSGTRVLL
jgi:type VI secretion system protein ImpG